MEENKKKEKFYAGGFLYNSEKNEVLLHKRDGNTPYYPHKWSFFGGLNESNETPEQCCVREWKEELNIEVPSKDLIPLCDYLNTEQNTWRYAFYYPCQIEKSEMTLGEGADFDWIPIKKVFEYDLSRWAKQDLEVFAKKI